MAKRLAIALCLLASAHAAGAQTADQVVERALTAMGGRAAHAKVHSRSTVGTITLATPAGEVTGSIEIWNAIPNKVRTLIKADLSALGAGPLVLDQRFDGTAGYALDTLQGNHEITGNQLDNLRNSSFPNSFLNYKTMGVSLQLAGKEKVGDRDAYVVIFEPPTGSIVREYIDAETYLPISMAMKVEVPQLGREVEQTTEFLDYREVDGIKLPFEIKASSAIQSYTISVTTLEHNVSIDDALFSKPR